MPSRISYSVAAVIRVSKPEFRRPRDRVAFAVHAYHLCEGYILVAVGDWKEDTLPDVDTPQVPVDGWNDDGELYTFTYVHPSHEFSPLTVKCLAMGNLLIIYSAPLRSESDPKTMNVDVSAVTKEGSLMGGYVAFDDLVERFVKELGPSEDPPARTQAPSEEKLRIESRRPVFHPMGQMVGRPLGLPVSGQRDRMPGILGNQGDHLPLGGNLVGLNDPAFAAHLRYPELQGGIGGARFDPIGPPGMPGYRPGDFTSERNPMHPDVMPPGPGRNFDPDNMFG